MKNRVYLSGGFKSNWQKIVTDELGDNFVFFNPREHGLEGSEYYTLWDIHYVKNCDIFFAYMEKGNPSGYGLAFELGIAYAMQKTIILIDEKSQVDAQFDKYFKILHRPSGIVLSDLEEGINYLKKFINT